MKTIGINFGFRPYFDEIYIFGLYLASYLRKRNYDVVCSIDSLVHPYALTFFRTHEIQVNPHYSINVDILIMLDHFKSYHPTIRSKKWVLFVNSKSQIDIYKLYEPLIHLVFTPIDLKIDKQKKCYFGRIESSLQITNTSSYTGISYTPNLQIIKQLLRKAHRHCLIFSDKPLPTSLMQIYDPILVFPTDITSIPNLVSLYWDTSPLINKFITLNLMSYGLPCWTTDSTFNKMFNLKMFQNSKTFKITIDNFLTFDECIDEIEKMGT